MPMSKRNELIIGFSEDESGRIETHLERLLPYFTPNRFLIVGGLTIRFHLRQKGINYPNRPFNDLDIISEDFGVLSPKVVRDFLIYHLHRPNEKDFYFALVDPVSRTKVDIFDYQVPPQEVLEVEFGGHLVKIPSVEDQLVKSVFDIQRISPNLKVDPKQFLDARLLLEIANLEKAENFWKKKKFPHLPSSIVEAFERANNIAQENPDWLQEKPFRKKQPYSCSECVDLNEFPITPMEEIYKVLGYVE